MKIRDTIELHEAAKAVVQLAEAAQVFASDGMTDAANDCAAVACRTLAAMEGALACQADDGDAA